MYLLLALFGIFVLDVVLETRHAEIKKRKELLQEEAWAEENEEKFKRDYVTREDL